MKKIAFCGGGTLGHFTPNVAIYEKLKKDFDCIYIGSKNGLEKEPASNIMPYYEIETVKLIRSLTLKNLSIPFKLAKGFFDAKKILEKEKPDIIFSKGGYVSVPVIYAANSLKIPCITHESDFTLGLANKLIAKKCNYVCTSFKETSLTLSNGVYTGSPIRKEIFNGNKMIVKKKLELDNNKKTILIVGGSLGSEKINYCIHNSLNYLKEFNIIHLTGKNKINENIKQNNYYQIEFVKDIENYLAIADIVITRGGSNTLFELLALSKPMLIIPLGKEQSRGDQILNAYDFQRNNYANVLYEEDLTTENFINSITTTFENAKFYKKNMKLAIKNGTEEICKLINKTIKNN